MSDTLIPVNLLTGFLGSGKTTLLNRWVRQPSMRHTLVVINEFGEVGLDHRLVTQSDEQAVVEMSSGCLCCTLRGDLSRTLSEALASLEEANKPLPERVVIETTGLVDPGPLLQLMMTDHFLAHRFRLDSVVCCVDSAVGEATLQRHEESQRQVALADRLLLTKTDLADETRVSRLANQLAKLNPAAEQWQIVEGKVDSQLLVGAGLYHGKTQRYQPAHWLKAERYVFDAPPSGAALLNPSATASAPTLHSDIATFSFEVATPIAPEVLENWLDLLMSFMGEKILRIAIVYLNDRDAPVALHGVQHIFHPPTTLPAETVASAASQFVFITQGVEKETVAELFRFFNS